MQCDRLQPTRPKPRMFYHEDLRIRKPQADLRIRKPQADLHICKPQASHHFYSP